jgi:glycosyltransferase involved in cell wall biosynthesis
LDTNPGIVSAINNLLFSKLPYILERFKNRKFEIELVQILKKHQIDVVQIEGLYMLQYLEVIRAKSRAVIAYRPHNIEYQIWDGLSRKDIFILKKLYFKLLSQRILKYELSILNAYDLIIPISIEDADFYNRLGNTKPAIVIPTSIEIQKFDNAAAQLTNPSIFFIGSLEWLPNQEGIIWFLNHCWSILLDKFPNLKWYIAGRNAPVSLIKKFSKPGIVWAGEIENASEFIKDKSIMIVPLFSGSGMRIKILEAFSHAKPVVSTTLGARGTMANDNENILLADIPQKFVEQIGCILEQAHLYKTISINGYEHARKNFDNNIISRALSNFYKQHLTFNI